MAKHYSKNGIASVVLRAKILDATSTTGAGLTGLTLSSAGLIISTIADKEAAATTYTQAGSTIETITTLGTYAAPTATKCRFKEVDATNHPGIYEFQFADARFAVSSAKSLIISVLGATNAVQMDMEVQLGTLDVNKGSDVVTLANGAHGGIAAVLTMERIIVASTTTDEPAMKLTGNGSGAGLSCIGQISGAAIEAYSVQGVGIKATGQPGVEISGIGATGASQGMTITGSGLTNGLNITGTGSGVGLNITGGSAGVKTTGSTTGIGLQVVGGSTSGDAILCTVTSGSKINADLAGTVASVVGAVGSVTGAVASVTGSVGSVTGHTNQTGDSYARIGALGAGLTSLASASNLTTVDTVVDAIKAVTDALPDSGALTTIAVDTARLTAARAGALTDWQDAGRLDLLLDAIKVVTDGLNDPTAAAIADAVADEVLTAGTHNVADSLGRRLRQMQEFGGYEGGAVWIDTVNGAAGTDDYENGTVNNPVNNIADALIIAVSIGLVHFKVIVGSSISLAASAAGYSFDGVNWTLALGSQDVTNTHFRGATVTGTGTGGGTCFEDCVIGTCTLAHFDAHQCQFTGTITFTEAATYLFVHCTSGVAGTGAPVINFGALVGNTSVNMREYSGGIQLEQMGATGTDTMSLEGNGQLIEGTCTGGTVVVRGNFTVSGITNITVVEGARIDIAQINAQCDLAISDASLATATNLATVDTVVDAIKVVTDALTDPATIATALLKLDLTGLTGEATRSLLNGIRLLRNKWTVIGNTLTVYKEDDTAVAWTATIATDSAADPIVSSDPA